jgi:signal peptidase I
MNGILQPGDTVEIVKDLFYYYHPIENRYLEKGDRIVVEKTSNDYVFYRVPRYFCDYPNIKLWYHHLPVRFVKKVVSNQVEIKFR